MNLEILVLKLVIPVTCTYGEPTMLGSRSIIDVLIVILFVEVGIARWLTPTNPSPRSVRLALCFDY